MLSIEGIKFKKNLFTAVIVATIFSSLTIWLIESPIKYGLFVFEVILITTLYIILLNYDLKFNTNHFLKIKIPLKFFLDFSLIIFSAVLIFFNIFQIQTFFQLPIAIACITLLAGYALLNIFNLKKYFTKLETFVLSVFIGFIFVSLVNLALLTLDESLRIILVPSFLIILGIVSFFIHLRKKEKVLILQNSFSKKIDILAIGTSLSFYVLFFSFIYPELSFVPGTDISKHLLLSTVLSRSPEFYTGFPYILFHSFESTLNTISGVVSIDYFHTTILTLNLFLPLTVYVFSKRFLESVDKRIPAISTLFYSIFSNFSFLYFIQLKLQGTEEIVLGMMRLVAQKAYFGSVYFAQPFAWVVPQSIGLMLFVFLLLLLGVRSIPQSRLIPLMSILIFSLFLTHIPQAFIFIVFLSLFSFISISKTLRLNEGLISSAIAMLGVIIVVAYTDFTWNPVQRTATFPSTIIFYASAMIPLTLFSFFWRKKILFKMNFLKKIKLSEKPYRFLSILLVSFYLIALVIWFFIDFNTTVYHYAGVIPWFVYPLLLGILGLLSLVSIRYFYQIFPNSFFFLILMLVCIMVILGLVLSFINVNISPTNFWEKRVVKYVILGVALLAPIPLIKFINGFDFKRKLFPNVIITVIISVIVISGFSSMALQSEFWYLATNHNLIEKNELDAVNYLKEVFSEESDAYPISPSRKSMSVITLSAPNYYLHNPDVTTKSKSPEIPLFLFRAHNLETSFLYMHERDFSKLNNTKSWIADHYLPLLPVGYDQKPVKIYNVSSVSYPLQQSDTTLIIPFDPRISYEDSWLFSYDMISQNNINYTVMFDSDHNALNNKIVLLSYDPPLDGKPPNFVDSFSSPNDWEILKGNWNFSSEGIHGKFTSGKRDNIIISPVQTRDATINTSFVILSADQKSISYVSIIYDWKDSENYSLAKVQFRKGKVYVLFETIDNGKGTTFPIWPGVLTNLSWKPGDIFNMTLSKQAEKEEIFLNGSSYLIKQGLRRSGFIGVSVDRAEEVFFNNFSIKQMNKLKQLNFSDYISYVSSGGNLIVLNTNGNGIISNLFLESDNLSAVHSENLDRQESNVVKHTKNMNEDALLIYELAKKLIVANQDPNLSSSIGKIIDKQNERLQDYSDAGIINDEVSNYNLVLDMTSFKNILPKNLQTKIEENQSILVAEKSIGNGTITFVNVYPFISDYNEGKILGNDFYKILGKLVDFIELKKIDSTPITNRNIQLMFKELEAEGNVLVNTKSMLFTNDLRFTNLTIRNNEGIHVIENVTSFDVNNYNKVMLSTTNASLENGKGLYSEITFYDTIKLELPKQAIVTVASNYNQPIRFEKVSFVQITNESPIDILVRQPKIQVNGITTLYEPISAKLSSKIGKNAQSLEILGNVTISMFMSDTYSLARTIDVKGQIERYPSLLDKDYLLPPLNFSKSNDTNVILIPFLLIPFIIAAIFLVHNPKKKLNSN